MDKSNQINRIKRLKKTIKTLWAGALSISGAGEAYQRFRHVRSGKTCGVILSYHRVVPRHWLPQVASLPGIVVCQESFDAQLRVLTREFDIISLDQFQSALVKKAPLPRKCVVITFDDGWQDNYLFAFPILKSYGVPATVFLTTGYVGTKKIFWPELMIFLLKSLQETRIDVSGNMEKLLSLLSGKGLAYLFTLLDKPISGEDAMSRFIDELKALNDIQVNGIIEALDECLSHPEFPYSQNSCMGWDQVREMSGSNITFGSHGVTHRLLTALDDRDLAKELSCSKTAIENELKVPVNTLAYPNGNFDNRVIQATKEAGYTGSVSTITGVNDWHTDPFALMRINIHEGNSTVTNGSFSSSLFSAYVARLL